MNTLTSYFVPQWISIAFLIAIPLPFILIIGFVRREARKIAHRWAYPVVITFFTLYLLYIVLASFNGWFNQVALPPKVLLLTTFPYAFLLFVVVLNTTTYKAIVACPKI